MIKRMDDYCNGFSENEKSKRKLLAFSILIIFVGALLLNFLTGYIADDYSYMNECKKFGEIISYEYNQYMTWSGRSVAHILARFFLLLPKEIYNVLNAFAFTWLTFVMYLFCNYKKKTKVSTYLFIVSCCFLFIPILGQTALWVTGSANYLWGTTIIVTFLLPYIMYSTGQTKFWQGKWHVTSVVIMFFSGVIAGWCNENTSGGALLLIFLLLIYFKNNQLSIKKWHLSGLVGGIVGFLFMILSPGYKFRTESAVGGIPTWHEKLEWMVLNIKEIINLMNEYFFELNILIAVFLVLYLTEKRSVKNLMIPLAMLFVSIAMMAVLAIPAVVANRAFFGSAVFLIVTAAYLLALLEDAGNSNRKIIYIIITILVVKLLCVYSTVLLDTMEEYEIARDRDAYVQEQMQGGTLEEIPIPHIVNANEYSIYYRLDQPYIVDHWATNSYLTYYEINSIIPTPYIEWYEKYYNEN